MIGRLLRVALMTAVASGCGGADFSLGTDAGEDALAKKDGPSSVPDSGMGTPDAPGTDAPGPGPDGATQPDAVTPGDTGVPKETGAPDVSPKKDAGASPCPADAPSGSCQDFGLSCEYPSPGKSLDPAIACDVVSVCEQGTWVTPGPGTTLGCPQMPGGTGCPGSYKAFAPYGPAPCTETALDCYFPDARCSCTRETSGGSGAFTWTCDVPVNPGQCPIPRPALGTPCSLPDSATCDYGTCEIAIGGSSGVSEVCRQGLWREAASPPCLADGGM